MKKILVVDDDSTVVKLMQMRLEGTGRFAVVTAAGGTEGVRRAETELPDLVLCDIDMPDMDGGAVAAELGSRTATKQIPLIFVSAMVTPEEAAAGAKAGRWPVMSKRSQFPDLLKKIDEALNSQS